MDRFKLYGSDLSKIRRQVKNPKKREEFQVPRELRQLRMIITVVSGNTVEKFQQHCLTLQ